VLLVNPKRVTVFPEGRSHKSDLKTMLAPNQPVGRSTQASNKRIAKLPPRIIHCHERRHARAQAILLSKKAKIRAAIQPCATARK